ncbi:MAG: flagellar basal body rod protein FlgB [Pseudomonadota bacterium]
MIFDLDNYLGLHAQAMKVRTDRSKLLAANIANADTPNFQARDVDFREVMRSYLDGNQQGTRLNRTRAGHFSEPTVTRSGGEVSYRVPMQPSLDGNTVEPDIEIAAFAENSLRYQATLRFLSGRITGLRDAITGGR